ncbi:multicopper oxidase domain-containing protein, partial [Klebsiella pneumoniae]|uniref:multicopper oxidase domain-containing protein n=1 Tax=Klebsiella pneumoniae TaxID=573 RepID=UPI0021801360
ISKLALVLDIYSSLSLIWRYSYCPVFQGATSVRKHTIDVPPGTKRSYRVTADALGRWAYHCHLLYHMEMGMFREVRVEE